MSTAPAIPSGASPEIERKFNAVVASAAYAVPLSGVIVLLVVGLATATSDRDLSEAEVAPEGSSSTESIARPTLPDGTMPLSPKEAVLVNSNIPVSTYLGPSAAPFELNRQTGHFRRAVDCLAAAVYYEAANESEAGQRAVAQVVLNRVRHRAWPNTVCGVVYEGSDRRTGCQFSFTCDGSLGRVPSASGWRRAVSVAEFALAGSVFDPVGSATHYHANYVVPYWASSLQKTAVIGAHIFYRWRGPLGEAEAFRQRYAGSEPLMLTTTTKTSLNVADEQLTSAPSRVEDPPARAAETISSNGGEVSGAVPKLEEDEKAGTLIVAVSDTPEGRVVAQQRSFRCRPEATPTTNSQARVAPVRPLGNERSTRC
jgi:hypothetical protein